MRMRIARTRLQSGALISCAVRCSPRRIGDRHAGCPTQLSPRPRIVGSRHASPLPVRATNTLTTWSQPRSLQHSASGPRSHLSLTVRRCGAGQFRERARAVTSKSEDHRCIVEPGPKGPSHTRTAILPLPDGSEFEQNSPQRFPDDSTKRLEVVIQDVPGRLPS